MANQTLEQFLADQQTLVEEREIESAKAYWAAAMDATAENEERAARSQAELEACYADLARFEALKALPEPDDADLRRQKMLLTDDFARAQMPREVIAEIARREMEIESLFASYRANLRGRMVSDNDLQTVLKESGDSEERREAWEAGKRIGAQAESKVLELVAIRNREAQRRGFADYYAMSLKLQELDEKWLFDTLEEVARQLDPAFLQLKAEFDAEIAQRFGIPASELRPWHYGDPFFQEAPAEDGARLDGLFAGGSLEDILLRFFDGIGLDIHDLLPRADLYEKPGKNQHAFCMTVGRGTGDVRVSCNLRPDAKWMGTLLHEFGHAAYENEIDPGLPFFLKSVAHIMTTEAIAELMGRFVTNGAWLDRWMGVTGEDGQAVAAEARRTQRTHMLVFTEWVQVITHFERELYRDPAQDLDTLWWDMVARYQRLALPEGSRPKGAWASKIHLASSPVYYHNYLLGEMMASQFLHTLRTQVVGSEGELVAGPKVGQWLIERIFRPGSRYTWNDLVARATGETLNPRFFVEEMKA